MIEFIPGTTVDILNSNKRKTKLYTLDPLLDMVEIVGVLKSRVSVWIDPWSTYKSFPNKKNLFLHLFPIVCNSVKNDNILSKWSTLKRTRCQPNHWKILYHRDKTNSQLIMRWDTDSLSPFNWMELENIYQEI